MSTTSESTSAPVAARRRTLSVFGGGTTGNNLLTNATGAMLLLLFAALGITIVRNHQLLSEHFFIGMLLVPPVLLKMSSTGYRFTRYYTGNARYRAEGPPVTPLRLLAPLLVLSTVVVFATGVLMLFIGPSSRGSLFQIHKLSFFAWLAVTAVHVLAHLPELPRALRADYDMPAMRQAQVPGRSGRMLAIAGALVLGLVLAILTKPDYSAWLNHLQFFGPGQFPGSPH